MRVEPETPFAWLRHARPAGTALRQARRACVLCSHHDAPAASWARRSAALKVWAGAVTAWGRGARSVEFGTIMCWYYLADRTRTFPRGTKVRRAAQRRDLARRAAGVAARAGSAAVGSTPAAARAGSAAVGSTPAAARAGRAALGSTLLRAVLPDRSHLTCASRPDAARGLVQNTVCNIQIPYATSKINRMQHPNTVRNIRTLTRSTRGPWLESAVPQGPAAGAGVQSGQVRRPIQPYMRAALGLT